MKGICHSKFFTNTVDCFESWEWIPRGFIEHQKQREYVSQGQVALYIGQCTSGKQQMGAKVSLLCVMTEVSLLMTYHIRM